MKHAGRKANELKEAALKQATSQPTAQETAAQLPNPVAQETVAQLPNPVAQETVAQLPNPVAQETEMQPAIAEDQAAGGSMLNYLIGAGVVLVASYFLYNKFFANQAAPAQVGGAVVLYEGHQGLGYNAGPLELEYNGGPLALEYNGDPLALEFHPEMGGGANYHAVPFDYSALVEQYDPFAADVGQD